MLNKIFLSFFFIFFIVTTSNLYANSQGYRDELPELKKLTDLSIGIRRINKGLKYEKKNKYDKKKFFHNFFPKFSISTKFLNFIKISVSKL